MIIDLQSTFSGAVASDGTRTGQAVTATAISTNVIDLRAPGTGPAVVDEGVMHDELYLVVQTLTAFATLTSLTITLESATDAGLTTGAVVHYSTGAILAAALTANTRLAAIRLPSGGYKRYLGLRYTVGGASATAGTLFAFLTPGLQNSQLFYPTGWSIA